MNYELKDFDNIRPYSDGELKQALEELLADRQFNHVLDGFVPWLPALVRSRMLKAAFYGIQTNTQFQVRFMKPFAKYILNKCVTSYTFDHPGLEPSEERYTFISNHRDIVLDSTILGIMLNEAGFPTTCEIAIGDNLIIYPWIRTLVRMNKAFLVERSLPPRELLASSKLMSNYMHYVINVKKENIWIAQREGRAKDSDDRTQDSVLKMMAMGGEGTPIERLKDLHIVPLTISYEYDPCDFLKAMEFQLKRDIPGWKKSKQDDLTNMKTGILGKKGRVYYRTAPCINTWLDELADVPKTELFREVARRLDRDIHRGYHLFPSNYVALDLLNGVPDNAERYTHRDKVEFEKYLQSRLDLIKMENKDEAFLRERILTMYANPVKNYRAARKQSNEAK